MFVRFALLFVTACRFGFDAVPADATRDSQADVGCADGTVEAFIGEPTLAGCRARWDGVANLRAPATGAACGGDVPCAVPADACAPGWQICGRMGDPGELSSRVTSARCAGETGHWVAAMDHCHSFANSICDYQGYDCAAIDGPCAEPVCCGDGCGVANQCKDGVWSEGTRAAGTFEQQTNIACGAFASTLTDGVLCCKPESIDPIGCADGTREAFTDLATYPAIAGCAATWADTKDLRAPPSGARCGNDAGPCETPADVCSPGWHLCGATAAPAEIATRITAEQCLAEPGRWSMAMSHCAAEDSGMVCDYSQFPCIGSDINCAESACCGTDCSQGNDCKDGIYPGVTRIAVNNGTSTGTACGAFSSENTDGLLCCR